jgi:hypothetical protein
VVWVLLLFWGVVLDDEKKKGKKKDGGATCSLARAPLALQVASGRANPPT